MTTTNYEKHKEEQCINCGSENTYESHCSVNGKDSIDCCVCDDCGWTENKPDLG